jgi:hypothetical protein
VLVAPSPSAGSREGALARVALAKLTGGAIGAVDDRLRRLVLVDGQIRLPAALIGRLLTAGLDADELSQHRKAD